MIEIIYCTYCRFDYLNSSIPRQLYGISRLQSALTRSRNDVRSYPRAEISLVGRSDAYIRLEKKQNIIRENYQYRQERKTVINQPSEYGQTRRRFLEIVLNKRRYSRHSEILLSRSIRRDLTFTQDRRFSIDTTTPFPDSSNGERTDSRRDRRYLIGSTLPSPASRNRERRKYSRRDRRLLIDSTSPSLASNNRERRIDSRIGDTRNFELISKRARNSGRIADQFRQHRQRSIRDISTHRNQNSIQRIQKNSESPVSASSLFRTTLSSYFPVNYSIPSLELYHINDFVVSTIAGILLYDFMNAAAWVSDSFIFSLFLGTKSIRVLHLFYIILLEYYQ